MSNRRGTGGNRFIAGDADIPELMQAIQDGLLDLLSWAKDTDRKLDLGQISVDTMRTRVGWISVSVTADLVDKEP